MERAGRAVAEHALEDFGNARSFTVVCGGGSNGGDGRVAARVLEEAGRDVVVVDAKPEEEEKDLGDPDVLIDALFGTGFEGEPRPGAARLIERDERPRPAGALGRPPLGSGCVDRRGGRSGDRRRPHGHLPRREGRALRHAGGVPRGLSRGRRHRARAGRDGERPRDQGRSSSSCLAGAPRATSTRPVMSSWSEARRGLPGRRASPRWPRCGPTPAM